MKIQNTLTKSKESFEPVKNSTVRMYVCGPTVYNYIHIGNARVYVFFDTVRSIFEYSGYKVLYVSNFTDIDDKIINRANQEGVPFNEVSRRFEEAFLKDIKNLGLRHADITPRATEHIDEMIRMIEGLIKKGYAYESNGDVYFSVESFKGYGKLSGRSIDEMRAGERVEPSENKKDPLDFALWKAAKPGEPYWESPFGKGRPGWHIECSVMSEKYLGFGFDIHGGGQDLIFPHHENEIAQAEAYHEAEPFVRFWVHNGLLTVKSEKMAKSLGNIILLKDALEVYGPDLLKFFYLSTHYRSPLDYSPDRFNELKKALMRILEAKKRAEDSFRKGISEKEDIENKLEAKIAEIKEEFLEALKDDLNTARAIAEVFEFVKELNAALDAGSGNLNADTAKLSVDTLIEFLNVFGIDLGRFEKFIQEKASSFKEEISLQLKGLASYYGISEQDIDEIIEKLIGLRKKFREEKNYAKADEIRDRLAGIGVKLEDTPQGTRYKIEETQ